MVPTAPQTYSQPTGMRRASLEPLRVRALGEEDVEEQQRGRDAPDDRQPGVQRVEGLVRVVVAGAEPEEHDDRDDRRDHGLQDHRVRRHLVPVDLADLVREPPLQAGHEQQPRERVVVDDRRGQEHPREDQRRRAIAGPLADRRADRLRPAGGAVRAAGLDHDHVAPGGPQVGGHHDDAAPEQVGPDRLLAALDLDAHVQRGLDARAARGSRTRRTSGSRGGRARGSSPWNGSQPVPKSVEDGFPFRSQITPARPIRKIAAA